MTKKPQEKIPFRELSSRKQLEVANPELSPEQQERFLKLIEFFNNYGIDYDQFTFENISKKLAYPNYDQYQHIAGQRDLKKWLQAIHNIQVGENAGLTRVEAVRQATSGWPVTETFDFLNWIKFYQEGTHLKYKTAQLWYENVQPGYFLQIKPDNPKPIEPVVDVNVINEGSEKKRIIEKQRQKIIGRLDSAEKLLRSPEGQLFAGPELEQLMEAIYTLKKKVQLVNKLSTSTRLYEDMIVREGNILSRKGFVKSADVLYAVAQGDINKIFYTIAQANNPPPPGTGEPDPINNAPPVPPPDDPSGAGHPGLPGTLPSEGPGMPIGQKSPPSAPSETQPVNPKSPAGPPPTAGMGPVSVAPDTDDVQSKGLQEFLEKIETGGKTEYEELAVEDDHLEVEDDTLEVEDIDWKSIDSIAWAKVPEEIIRRGQMAPPAVSPVTTTPASAKPDVSSKSGGEEPIEITDDTLLDNEIGKKETPVKDFDHIIDSALANVTVADVVAKLEDIAKIFKTREIPRQLSLVDMMLDSLNLASYFPSLSEAINKSLESNNYVSTRLEDIISRLRGAMSGRALNLKGNNNQSRASEVATNLQAQQEREEKRKQMKKEQEALELEEARKETPELEVSEDLGTPAVPAPVPRPVRPPAV